MEFGRREAEKLVTDRKHYRSDNFVALSPVHHTQNFIQFNGIVMILINELSNFSLSFMFYLRQSAGRKYHKSESIFVSSLCNIARITALKEWHILNTSLVFI